MTKQMLIRIDSELKKKVGRFAHSEGKSTSQIIRELLEEYIRNRDVEGYIDDLWNCAGKKMTSRGFKPSDIPQIIKEVRKSRK